MQLQLSLLENIKQALDNGKNIDTLHKFHSGSNCLYAQKRNLISAIICCIRKSQANFLAHRCCSDQECA